MTVLFLVVEFQRALLFYSYILLLKKKKEKGILTLYLKTKREISCVLA